MMMIHFSGNRFGFLLLMNLKENYFSTLSSESGIIYTYTFGSTGIN